MALGRSGLRDLADLGVDSTDFWEMFGKKHITYGPWVHLNGIFMSWLNIYIYTLLLINGC